MFSDRSFSKNVRLRFVVWWYETTFLENAGKTKLFRANTV